MPLWGATDSDESKPKFLTDEQKKLVYATKSGWVLENGALTGNCLLYTSPSPRD